MSLTDLGIVVLGGLIGWGVVSWIISIVRQQRQPPIDLTQDGSPPPVTERKRLSLADISAQWSGILGVPESATAQEIETAYHTRIAECDRIRFSSAESPEAKSAAESQRAKITQAFEFIRPFKG